MKKIIIAVLAFFIFLNVKADGENIIYYKIGTIYYTISAGQKREMAKERAMLLHSYIYDLNEP